MSTSIKLSSETRELLKTASLINNSIKIEAGNSIKTISPSASIILEAEVSEVFPEEFSIYELNRFLSVLSLDDLKDADLIFNNQNFVDVKQGRTSVKYKFAAASLADTFAVHPGRKIVLPTEDLTVDLTSDELKNLQRMASVLGHKTLEFRVVGEKAYLTTTSPDLNDSSSDSMVELADVPGSVDGSYKILFSNMILPAGDYQVTICAAGISRWIHKTRKITVFIGTEQV